MKKSLGLALGVVAALIACLWWASRSAGSSQEGASVDSSREVASVGPRNASAGEDAGDAARTAGEASLDLLAQRTVRLELLRFPDKAPLAMVQVEIAPVAGDSASSWFVTDASGRLEVEVPAGVSKLDVRAVGFAPGKVQLEHSAAQLHVLLTPTSGLFGRVVDRKNKPVAGAEVRLEVSHRRLFSVSEATRSRSEVRMSEYRGVEAHTSTNTAGFYFLEYPTTSVADRVRVAVVAVIATGALDVELPRATAQLDDIVLSTQSVLAIRVVDAEGLPVVGARVSSRENPHQPLDANPWTPDGMTTGNDGVVKWRSPALPSSFVATFPGMRPREQRFDDQVVAPATRVESLETRVDLVLEPARCLFVRVLDAETRRPVLFSKVQVEFSREGRRVASDTLELDAHGEATLLLDGRKTDDGVVSDFDVARLWAWASDYRRDSTIDVDLHATLSSEPIELLLEPEAGTAVFRGRVVRGDEPVAGLQVGVCLQRPSNVRAYDYKRALTDSGGHFVVRCLRHGGDEVLTAYPHWFRWDEFGFIGPLDADVAIASEHVLELKPAVRAPAILRGVSKGGTYWYYVWVTDGDLAVSTTINGAPIEVDTDGEARVTLQLPSDRPSRVSIGYRASDTYDDNRAGALAFDPAHPGPPLVFDVQQLCANIAGRVIGFSADEIPRLSVAFVRSGGQGASTVRVAADATFRIDGLTIGSGELALLIDGDSPDRATLLSRTGISLRSNLDDVQLTCNPMSLPESPSTRR